MESDLPALADIAVAGLTFLIERYEPDRAGSVSLDPAGRLPLLQHVLGTGAVFVAEESAPVGFSSAVVRDGVWYLAQLWVLPEHHGRGVGAALIDAALEWGTGAGAFTVVSSQHPSAETLYMRRSMFPVWTQLELRGPRTNPPSMPDGISDLSGEDQGWVDRLERETRGAARPEDHSFFRSEARGLALRRHGKPAGYVYVWPDGRVGPGAAAASTDIPLLVRAGFHLGAERTWCAVPSANWAALKELASFGFRTAGSSLFMASQPWPDGSRYLSSGGALA